MGFHGSGGDPSPWDLMHSTHRALANELLQDCAMPFHATRNVDNEATS